MASEVDIVAMTHRGAVRPLNEDTILVGGWIRLGDMDAPAHFRLPLKESVLCLVADGMGGHRGGAEASRRACVALAGAASGLLDHAAIGSAIAAASQEIEEAGRSNPELTGMGTTVAGLVVRPDGLIWFNVGDSPVLRLRRGFLRQISVDDVPLGERRGARSNRITQCLGGGGGVPEPHVGEERREPGLRCLLASDGLTDVLALADIEAALAGDDPVEGVRSLHEAAMRAGAPDNVSAVLVGWDDTAEGESDGQERPRAHATIDWTGPANNDTDRA